MKRFGKKGQVSTEYLVITGFVLVVISIFFAYSLITLSENAKLGIASDTVNILVSSANQVSALGPGNSIHVNIEVPNDVYSATATGYSVEYTVNVMGGRTDVWKRAKNQITTASLPTSPGVYEMKVEMADGNITITQA